MPKCLNCGFIYINPMNHQCPEPDTSKTATQNAAAMSQPKFKVGDRVKVIDRHSGAPLPGKVEQVNAPLYTYDVRTDAGALYMFEEEGQLKPHAPGKRERMAETLDLCRKFIATELLCAGRLPHPIMRQIDEILAMPEDQ